MTQEEQNIFFAARKKAFREQVQQVYRLTLGEALTHWNEVKTKMKKDYLQENEQLSKALNPPRIRSVQEEAKREGYNLHRYLTKAIAGFMPRHCKDMQTECPQINFEAKENGDLVVTITLQTTVPF